MNLKNILISKQEYLKERPQWEGLLKELARMVEKSISKEINKFTMHFRVKNFDSLYYKANKKKNNATDNQNITDILGIRIICPFLDLLTQSEKIIRNDFHVIEIEHKGLEQNFNEFGYQSIHLLIKVPQSLLEKFNVQYEMVSEIQIRTILQEAWAEVEHELIYKSDSRLYNDPLKRKLAAINANLTISDILFQEIRDYQKDLQIKINQRKSFFIDKANSSYDDTKTQSAIPMNPSNVPMNKDNHNEMIETPLFNVDDLIKPLNVLNKKESFSTNQSINTLLISSLNAHNAKDFAKAISLYSELIQLMKDNFTRALIFIHRGMAYFSQSNYIEAIEDFSEAIAIDPKNTKAYYYRGLCQKVIKQYHNALMDFNKCLQMDPLFSIALQSRAYLYYHLGDYSNALTDCEAALSINTEDEKLVHFLEFLQPLVIT